MYVTEHVDVASSLNNIVTVLSAQGKNREALEMHQQALAIQKMVLGPEHVDVVSTQRSIRFLVAKLRQAIGQY